MATELHPGRPGPAPRKYEAFVEGQLARARARIRYLDLAAAGLGLLILTLGYGLSVALCDRCWELSPLARQSAFALYVAGALAYVGLLMLRPLFRPINPYYAARRLEQTIPEAKNSVVNWLDLHQQAIAPAFRSAISHQAAKDLAAADLEQAISARRTSWLGAAAGALFVGMLILFVLGPRQFLSLMNRAFAPFVEAPIATRTRLLLERPEGGDATIPVGKAVGFSVWVEGRVPEPSSPEALKLLYRYNLNDPYQMRALERGESSRQWFTSLLAAEVHQGFWYKIAGGDAETPEYRVQVRSTPLLTGFDVTYHYRPYLGWPDRTTHEQNLQDLRGTEVTLLARTNRTVRAGQLRIAGQAPIGAELVPEDPQALRFHLRLESDGLYRIWFRSSQGEQNSDPMPYTIRVLQDQPPQVELTKPGEEIQLPANGVLRLEGAASDDFGITRLDLRMKLDHGPALPPKPYRKGATLRRGDGSYPQVLAYRDFVELDKLQREDGQPLGLLRPGSKLEYWLEATDNCDYPGPNIGQSKHFTVTIQPADSDQKKQQQARQDARQEQQTHEKQQDQELKNEKRQPPDGSQQQQGRRSDAQQPGRQGAQPSDEELNKQKAKIEEAIKKNEQQQRTGAQGQPAGDQAPEGKGGGKGPAASERPADQSHNQDQEGKAQPGPKRAGAKPEAEREKGRHQGDGHTASQSNGENGENRRGPKGRPGRRDQDRSAGNRERSAPTPEQKDGSSQTGKNPEDRQKAGEKERAQDRAQPQSAQGANNKSNPAAAEKDSSNRQGRPEQNRAADQAQGRKQNERKNGPGNSAAQPSAGQGGAGEKADRKNDPNAPAPATGSGQGEQKAQSSQEPDRQAGAKQPLEGGKEKTEKRAPGQERSNEQTGQPKNAAKERADGQTGQEQQQKQQSASPQSSQKKADSPAGQQPEKGSKHTDAESRGEQTEGSQGKTGQSAAPPPQGKDERGQAASAATKGTRQERSDGSGGDNDTNLPRKPAGKEERAGRSGSGATQDQKEKGRNPANQGKQGTDKTEDMSRTSSASGGADKASTQQSPTDQPGGDGAAAKWKEHLSALSKALQGRDEKGRAEARKQLEQLRDKAHDPAIRRAARAALENGGKAAGERPSSTKDETQPDGMGRADQATPAHSGEKEPGQGKGTGPNQPAQKQPEAGKGPADAGRATSTNANRTGPEGNSRPEAGARGSQAGSPRQSGGSGAAGSRGGNEPTAQTPRPDRLPDKQPSGEEQAREPGTAANAAYRKQAGELQLEEIKKKINPDVLKQLHMTQEDFDRFVKAYEAMLRRKQPSGAAQESLIGPQRGNRSLPNQKVREVAPREQGKGGTLQRLDASLAPPEFREAYKEFSRRLSELEQAKEKK